jgi:hypothetical protein
MMTRVIKNKLALATLLVMAVGVTNAQSAPTQSAQGLRSRRGLLSTHPPTVSSNERTIKIDHPTSKAALIICEVEVYTPDGIKYDLASLGAHAFQSSSYTNGGWLDTSTADRAIDGKYDYGGRFDPLMCSHTTNTDGGPWWEVNIPGNLPIGRVVVFPRQGDGLEKAIVGSKVFLDGNLLGKIEDNRGISTFYVPTTPPTKQPTWAPPVCSSFSDWKIFENHFADLHCGAFEQRSWACSIFGGIANKNGITANTACCACGGGGWVV